MNILISWINIISESTKNWYLTNIDETILFIIFVYFIKLYTFTGSKQEVILMTHNNITNLVHISVDLLTLL